jgi:hypothetical protein
MILPLLSLLLSGAAPAELQVDVGHIELAKLPAMKRQERPLPTPEMATEVGRILGSGRCSLRGQSANRFDIDIPYAALVEPDGGVQRVVVGQIGCAELESYAGLVVLELARLGDFKASATGQARWYGDTLNFNLR